MEDRIKRTPRKSRMIFYKCPVCGYPNGDVDRVKFLLYGCKKCKAEILTEEEYINWVQEEYGADSPEAIRKINYAKRRLQWQVEDEARKQEEQIRKESIQSERCPDDEKEMKFSSYAGGFLPTTLEELDALLEQDNS